MKRYFLFLLMTGAAVFAEVPHAKSAKIKTLKTAATTGYAKHLGACKRFKIDHLKDGKSISDYKKTGSLVAVKTLGKGYRIQKLEYSHAILVPEAKAELYAIAKNFYKKSRGSTLTYTSLTRTISDQEKLRKTNGNAAEGFSSHNFGNSFDISYVRFNDRLAENPRLADLLEKQLAMMQKDGKIYYIKEKKQSCFHVTVR